MNLKQFVKDVKEEFSIGGFMTVIGAFLFSLSIVGLHGVVKNQFMLPVSEALGVTKAATAIWDSARSAAGVAAAAGIGIVYKKLGPRGLSIFAGATVALGYVVLATLVQAGGLPVLYLSGGLIGIGNAMAGGLMFFTIVKPWWNKAFGTFSALCGTASGVGGVLFTTTVTKSITDGGYQAGAWKVAALTMAISVIGGLLMQESPNDVIRNAAKAEKAAKARGEKVESGKVELGKKKEVKVADGIPAFTAIDFLKCPITWMMLVMMFMALFNVATSLFSPMALWKGYDEPNVVGGAALSMYSFLLIWTKIGSGVLRDALGMKAVIPVMYVPAIICICWNLFGTVPVNLYPTICGLMAFSGTATQLLVGFVTVQAYGKYYNVNAHSVNVTFFNFAGIFIAPLRHIGYDMTGSYAPTLWVMLVFAICQVVLAFVALKVGKAYNDKWDVKYGVTAAKE